MYIVTSSKNMECSLIILFPSQQIYFRTRLSFFHICTCSMSQSRKSKPILSSSTHHLPNENLFTFSAFSITGCSIYILLVNSVMPQGSEVAMVSTSLFSLFIAQACGFFYKQRLGIFNRRKYKHWGYQNHQFYFQTIFVLCPVLLLLGDVGLEILMFYMHNKVVMCN